MPKKLLEQFAYDDPITKSKRLWQYQKGKAPWGRASPKSATRRQGHFAHPENAATEAELEERLEREFEHPVNQFIEAIGYRTFVLQPRHIRALTGYLTMLFNRSRARRAASPQQVDIMVQALKSLLSDEERLSALIGKLTMEIIRLGLDVRMVTREEVVAAIEKNIAGHSDADEPQRRYIQTIETMIKFADQYMLNGDWNITDFRAGFCPTECRGLSAGLSHDRLAHTSGCPAYQTSDNSVHRRGEHGSGDGCNGALLYKHPIAEARCEAPAALRKDAVRFRGFLAPTRRLQRGAIRYLDGKAAAELTGNRLCGMSPRAGPILTIGRRGGGTIAQSKGNSQRESC